MKYTPQTGHDANWWQLYTCECEPSLAQDCDCCCCAAVKDLNEALALAVREALEDKPSFKDSEARAYELVHKYLGPVFNKHRHTGAADTEPREMAVGFLLEAMGPLSLR